MSGTPDTQRLIRIIIEDIHHPSTDDEVRESYWLLGDNQWHNKDGALVSTGRNYNMTKSFLAFLTPLWASYLSLEARVSYGGQEYWANTTGQWQSRQGAVSDPELVVKLNGRLFDQYIDHLSLIAPPWEKTDHNVGPFGPPEPSPDVGQTPDEAGSENEEPSRPALIDQSYGSQKPTDGMVMSARTRSQIVTSGFGIFLAATAWLIAAILLLVSGAVLHLPILIVVLMIILAFLPSGFLGWGLARDLYEKRQEKNFGRTQVEEEETSV